MAGPPVVARVARSGAGPVLEIDTNPTDGNRVIRDKSGRRIGSEQRTLGGDVILRDRHGFRTGTVSPPR